MVSLRTKVGVVAISLWLPLLMFLASLQGCETGTSGALRPLSPSVEHGITNTVTMVQTAATAALPVPWSTATEAAAAAVLAVLAAWQGLTHSIANKNTKAITALQNTTKT
jgi:hypothetical protein